LLIDLTLKRYVRRDFDELDEPVEFLLGGDDLLTRELNSKSAGP
jgi:hypothetical protein